MKKNLVKIISASLVVFLFLSLYNTILAPPTQTGEKIITLVAIDKRDNPETIALTETTYQTNAKYLGELLDEINEKQDIFALSGAKDDQFGRLLTGISNVEQNAATNQYWSYESSNNAECIKSGFCTGVDQLPIEDGNNFTFIIK